VDYQAPTVQREVVYPTGKYVLHGDGITDPWQWVWIPAAPPPPSPPPSDYGIKIGIGSGVRVCRLRRRQRAHQRDLDALRPPRAPEDVA